MTVPSYITGAVGDASNANNTGATAAFSHTAGNPILVACQADDVDVTGVTDTAGNAYAKLGSTYTGGGTNQSWWFSPGTTGHATNVVTQAHSGGAWPRIVATEWSAGATHDATYAPAGNQDNSSPFTSTAATTAQNDSVIVGQFSNRDSGGAMSSSAPSVFRLETASQDFGVASNDAATAGSWSVAVVSASTTENHSCFAVALKAAAAGPTVTVGPTAQSCYVGATNTFTVSATTSGGTLHYQWKDDGSNVGTDSNSYTTAAGTLSDSGSQITCVVTDDNGSATSNAATWTVNPVSTTAWIAA